MERVLQRFRYSPTPYSHFNFCLSYNSLLKRRLSGFEVSGRWLQTHFEIIEDGLLVGFKGGDFLELHVAHHDLLAADRRQLLDNVAQSIFVCAIRAELVCRSPKGGAASKPSIEPLLLSVVFFVLALAIRH